MQEIFTFAPYRQRSRCLPTAGTSFDNPLCNWPSRKERSLPQGAIWMTGWWQQAFMPSVKVECIFWQVVFQTNPTFTTFKPLQLVRKQNYRVEIKSSISTYLNSATASHHAEHSASKINIRLEVPIQENVVSIELERLLVIYDDLLYTLKAEHKYVINLFEQSSDALSAVLRSEVSSKLLDGPLPYLWE